MAKSRKKEQKAKINQPHEKARLKLKLQPETAQEESNNKQKQKKIAPDPKRKPSTRKLLTEKTT